MMDKTECGELCTYNASESRVKKNNAFYVFTYNNTLATRDIGIKNGCLLNRLIIFMLSKTVQSCTITN